MRSAKVSADNPSVALRAPAPFTQGSLWLCNTDSPPVGKAAKRRAGSQALPIEAGSRPGTFVPRPHGERSRKGNPLPGFRRKPERIRIIFPGDMCGGKNTPRGAKCRGRLGGPGAQAECHRHRRNAGAGSWKWLRHFHETPHGAKCRRSGVRRTSGTRAQCFAIVSAPEGR